MSPVTQNGAAAVAIGVLGPLRVDGPHGPIAVRGLKERTLLAVLTAHRGRTVPVPVLVEALWGDAPPPSAQKSLQTFVLRVRKALEPDRSAPALVVTDSGGYRLTVPATAVDAERFADLVTSARAAAEAGRRPEALRRLSEGLALWRGPAYGEFTGAGFAQAEARRLDEIRQGAVEESIAVRLDLEGADAVVPDLERLVREHPYRERLWALLIRALYRQGRQGAALGAFDRARRLLGAELGVEPGRELRELHARVLAQDPGLDPPRPAAVLPADLVPAGAMLGRDRELDRLTRLWARARDGAAVGVVVRGPPAAGGLRLAQELAVLAVTDGAVVSCLDRPAPPRDRLTGPVLVVADRAHASRPAPGQLVVVLAGEDHEPPEGAELLDLAPLAPEDAHRIIAAHVRPDDLTRATAEILASTQAWPADLDRAAARWARDAATAMVRTAAASVTRTADELARARRQLSDGVLSLGTEPPAGAAVSTAVSEVCPWRGLAAYDVKDAPWFAGRERLVAELLARVAGSRLVAMVGPSGSGKSSALRAGLIAALQGGALPGSAGWTYLLFRPGPHPLRELTRHTLQAGFPAAPLGDLLEQLIRGDDVETGRRVILAVDQLEEVWTGCQDRDERTTFLEALADLAADPLSPVTVVLTVRPDFLPRLAEHPRIADPLADNSVLVGTPTPAEVVRAVQRPAAAGGLRLQLGLTDAIADDAAGEPGLLPLLSTALTRLWVGRDGRDLTLAGYVAVGGLAGAISGMAEDAFTGLDDVDREAARVLLLRLAGPGQGSAVTRRRVPLAEIASLPNPRIRAVVEPLASARLLTVAQDSVEVAHEALFTGWPRLRTWLAEDATTRDVLQRLAAAAADWNQQERDPGLLWQGTRLAAGRDAAQAQPDAVTQVERDFLDAGAARLDAERRDAETRATAAARQVRRLRWLVSGIVLLLVAATVVGAVAVAAQRRAQAATESAEARRLAAQAVTEQHPDLGLLSAVEAVHAEPGPETYGALLTLLARSPRIVTQVHTQGRFLRAAASADGSTVYLAENGPVWRAVDALSGEERWTADLATQAPELATDPAGRGVLTTLWPDGRQHIVLLDGADGGQVWATAAPAGNELGYGAAWLADGRWLVAGTGGIVVGNGDTGRIESETPWPAALAGFLPDFVTAWPDGRVGLADNGRTMLYDPSTGAVTPFGAPGSVQAVSVTGTLAAVDLGDPDRPTIRLHDPTGALVGEPIPLPAYSGGVTFSPDGTELTVGAGQTLQLRDGRTGELRTELAGHSGAVMDIAYAGPARDMLWTAGRDGAGIAWDRTGQHGILRTAPSPARTWLGDTDRSGTVAVGLAAPSGAYNTVSVLDPRTGSVTHPELPMPADCRWCEPVAVAITPDGRTALAGILQYPEIDGEVDYSRGPEQDRGYLARWDTSTGSLTGTTELPWPPAGLAVTADGRGVVVNGNRATELIELATGAVRWGPVPHTQMQDRDATRTVVLSPDGRRVLVGTGDGAQILDAATGETLAQTTFSDPDVVSATAFSPDGVTVMLGTYGGYLHVLSAGDLNPLVPRRLTTGGWLVDLAASPSGDHLASMGSDGDLLIWETATWQPLGQPISDNNGWGFLRFDPDGRTLRAVHQDGTVLTFLVDPDAWIRQACAVANRDLTVEESATIRPGQPLRSTCAGYG